MWLDGNRSVEYFQRARRVIAIMFAAVLSLPNPQWTPGAVRPLTPQQICQTRWGRDVRHVTMAMKRHVFRTYGIPWSRHAEFEVDHLVPRELGGADWVQNLWPQPRAEARMKDHEENRFHRDVCAGTVTLEVAQQHFRAWGTQ